MVLVHFQSEVFGIGRRPRGRIEAWTQSTVAAGVVSRLRSMLIVVTLLAISSPRISSIARDRIDQWRADRARERRFAGMLKATNAAKAAGINLDDDPDYLSSYPDPEKWQRLIDRRRTTTATP